MFFGIIKVMCFSFKFLITMLISKKVVEKKLNSNYAYFTQKVEITKRQSIVKTVREAC